MARKTKRDQEQARDPGGAAHAGGGSSPSQGAGPAQGAGAAGDGGRRDRTLSRRWLVGLLVIYGALVGVLVFPGLPRIWNELNRRVMVDAAARTLRHGVEIETWRRWGADAGKRHGPWRCWRDGDAFVGSFRAGERVGVWTHFAPDGAVIEQRRFADGALAERRTAPPWWDDPAETWRELGDGIWTVLAGDGSVARQSRWLDGRQVEERIAPPWWGDPAADLTPRPAPPPEQPLGPLPATAGAADAATALATGDGVPEDALRGADDPETGDQRVARAAAAHPQGRPDVDEPTGPPLPPAQVGQMLQQARALVARERPREALDQLLLPLLARMPREGTALVLAGEAHFALEEYEQAAARFEAGVAAAPELRGKVFNQGRAYLKLQRPDEALAVFATMTAEENPILRARGFLGRGLALQDLGRPQQAAEAFRLVLDLDPDDYRARYQLGLLALADGELATARGHFEEVLSRSPLHHGAAYNLALALTRAGLDEPAAAARQRHGEIMAAKKRISALHEHLAAQPYDLDALAELGDIHAGLDAHRDAAVWYENAFRLRPQDGALGLKLAAALANGGRPGNAEEVYELLLSRTPPVSGAVAPLAALLRARGAEAEAAALERRHRKIP